MAKTVTLSYRAAMAKLAEMPEWEVDGSYRERKIGRPKTAQPKQFNPTQAGFSLALLKHHAAAATAVVTNPNSQSALDTLALSAADLLSDIARVEAKLASAAAKRSATCASRPPKPDKWQYLVNGQPVTRAQAAQRYGVTESSLRVMIASRKGRPLQKLVEPADAPAYVLEVARILHNAQAMPVPEKRDRRTKSRKRDNQVGGEAKSAGGP